MKKILAASLLPFGALLALAADPLAGAFPFAMPPVLDQAGYVDMGYLSPEPAGSHGRLVARGGMFVDGRGQPTERYPWNPNGSAGGLTGFTSADGRATIMMPHPERGFRGVQISYRPADLFTGDAGPWMRMFRNAYAFAAKAAGR